MRKNIIILIICLFVINFSLFGETVRISQIDTSRLLFNQDINLYVSVTDKNGVPIKNLKKQMFTLSESADGKEYKEVEIDSFIPKGNYEAGINFLLLVDNSGSMYNDMNNRKTSNESVMRINLAKKAISSFVQSVTNPNDKIGIAAYNSNYTIYSRPSPDKTKVTEKLDKITKPEGDEGWTEIYSSLFLAIDEFKSVKGRKVIIILSDGENMPFYKKTGKKHKKFGTKTFKYTEPIEEAQKEGVSVFAINFGYAGERMDKNMRKIASETGGTVFDAHSQSQLKNIYSRINQLILNEYLITYKATMDPTDKKFVKLNFKGYKTTRFYFSSTIFGMPLENFSPLLFLALLAALLLLFLLSLFKFQNKNKNATIEILDTHGAKAMTQMFTLNKGKTVIGGANNADMTIMGTTNMKDNHATIVFDNKTKQYTIVAQGNLKVNNKKVSKKTLESGDVVNVDGVTIVFDEGMTKI